MSNNTPAFKKLHKKWAKILEKSGFVDIEEYDSPREMLKRWHGQDFKGKTPEQFAAHESYYLQATHLLNNYPFKSEKDKKIWTLHAEGVSIRDIAKQTKAGRGLIAAVVQEVRKKILNGSVD